MTTSTKRLVVIVGPTGSGKTDLSIRIALHYGAPILSTDSRQMYRGLPIGTAQPTADQLQAVEHHFIASHDLADNLSCGEYETQALACLERLFAGHDCVVAVGGSGLYVKALCEGMDDLPQADENLRRELAVRLRTEGLKPSPDSCGRSIRIIMRWSTAATLRASSGHWKSACKPGSPTRGCGLGGAASAVSAS